MSFAAAAPVVVLVLTVAAVGVLHTVVPDHWVPITLMARQRGWSRRETARAALQAGAGHVVTTLAIGLVVWFAGVAFAARFGRVVDTVASCVLVLFGGWIAFGAWRESRRGDHGHGHRSLFGHAHRDHHHRRHDHRHDHGEPGPGVHGPEPRRLDTGHGQAELSIFEDDVPPRFRFTAPAVDWVRLETVRPDGMRQAFTFARRQGFWESIEEIPEPHGFDVLATIGHGQHDHLVRTRFVEHDHDRHDHHHHATNDALYLPLIDVAVLTRHAHAHRHGNTVHVHRHDHAADTDHDIAVDATAGPPEHTHRHRTTGRTALLLIMGSSPMVEGIPAFFAASRFGVAVISFMAVVFAASTIGTYVVLCTWSAARLQRVSLGRLERFGEMISGVVIAAVGLAFCAWPVL